MKKYAKMIVFYLAILLVIIAVVTFLNPLKSEKVEMTYSQLISELNNKTVSEIKIDGTKATGKLGSGKEFEVVVPEYVMENQLSQYITDDPMLKVEIAKDNSWWISLLPTLIFLGFMIFFLVMMGRQNGGRGGVMGFAKSRAKVGEGDKKVTFGDVAGADEEKAELEEIVDFLKSPDRYNQLGARIPKGVLLVGPPGTGKTLLARAVAGEAGVPFFSISGSDFVEMFVGVGAARVRDLFENAKKSAPCIIFIDEIDAVGRHRGAGLGGGHDEREQTLNQILVEMDGFGANEGVIIIAATNRPDILDPALLRPGRFDRQILVNVPDVKGRREILDVHKKGKPLGKSVDLNVIAKGTPGFTGADLANLMNEAALLTARRKGKVITMKELEEAIKRVIAGPEKRSKVVEESDNIITAYHEAGHAIVMEYLHNGEEVHEISIIPRGMAAGYTISLPTDDSQHMSKGKLMDQIAGLLGGRAAEKTALEDICTGASNDIERATTVARKMVTEWGMSERLGPMTFGHDDGEVFLGKDIGRSRNYSEEVAAIIDKEIKAIVESAYQRACDILEEKKDKLIEIAETLLKEKTITGKEFRKLYNAVDVETLEEAEVVETIVKDDAEQAEIEMTEVAAEAEAEVETFEETKTVETTETDETETGSGSETVETEADVLTIDAENAVESEVESAEQARDDEGLLFSEEVIESDVTGEARSDSETVTETADEIVDALESTETVITPDEQETAVPIQSEGNEPSVEKQPYINSGRAKRNTEPSFKPTANVTASILLKTAQKATNKSKDEEHQDTVSDTDESHFFRKSE